MKGPYYTHSNFKNRTITKNEEYQMEKVKGVILHYSFVPEPPADPLLGRALLRCGLGPKGKKKKRKEK